MEEEEETLKYRKVVKKTVSIAKKNLETVPEGILDIGANSL